MAQKIGSKMSDGSPQDFTHWLLLAVGSLAGAIGALWKRNESRNATEIKRLEGRIQRRDELLQRQDAKIELIEKHVADCEKESGLLRVQIARMEERMNLMDVRQDDQESRDHETQTPGKDQ